MIAFVGQARLDDCFDATDSRILILIAKSEVIGRTTAFPDTASDGFVCAYCICTYTWVVFADDVLQISLSCTLVAGELDGRIAHLTRIWQTIGSGARRYAFISIKALGFDRKLHSFDIVNFTLTQTLGNRLSDLLTSVVTGSWHIQSMSDVDLLSPFRRFEGSRASGAQYAIVLGSHARVSCLVLTRAQSTIYV